ncbi:hypothetical protein AC578_1314 [Pseudocercospora eumusae]|uniref:Apple domain-containing protein n=1 Tax=Pseudocercospora eumusae TaxID=321146 RepID=A0A139HU89_9PEZI|nr:hypothetical protein AC578_1314 [Pseudocercospora eumusae]
MASELEKRTLPTCPGLDGYVYTGPGGKQYRIRCNMDTINGGYLDLQQTPNLEVCMQRCGQRADCRWVTFDGNVNGGGNCYLKHTGGGDLPKAGIKRALKLG